MEADELSEGTPSNEEPDDGDDAPVPPTALEVTGPAGPLVGILDTVLGHLQIGASQLRADRKQAIKLALEGLRVALLDLGERVAVAEAERVRLEGEARAAAQQAMYYRQLANAQDRRNETLVIGVVEAVTALEVAAARLRQVRARVGMEDVVHPPDLPPEVR